MPTKKNKITTRTIEATFLNNGRVKVFFMRDGRLEYTHETRVILNKRSTLTAISKYINQNNHVKHYQGLQVKFTNNPVITSTD